MIERLPIDLIVDIGIFAGPDEYEQIAKTSKRNAIILQKPYIIRVTSELLVTVTTAERVHITYKGESHSFNDQPAVIWYGLKYWYRHGEIHRDNDQPAIIRSNGSKEWYRLGEIHRDNDQPAAIWSDGTKYWYQHGKLHRDNDQPAIINSDGWKEWYQYGKLIK
jgi:hypothetical protein